MKRYDTTAGIKAKEVLRNLGPDSIPALIQMLKLQDRYPKSSYNAWKSNLPKLLSRRLPTTAGDYDNYICRYNAASLLGRFGPEAKAAVPDLVELLSDRTTIVRCYAAEALGRIGPEAKGAVPNLRGLKDGGGVFASWALERIESKTNSEAALKQLVLAVDSDDEDVADAAVAILCDTGLATLALPPLLDELRTPGEFGWEKRLHAANHIAYIGVEARAAIKPLIDALEVHDDTGGMEHAAMATALGMIGPEAKPAVPTLLNLMNGKGGEAIYFHSDFAEALQRIDPIAAAQFGVK
jgi:HEAT repeat protein